MVNESFELELRVRMEQRAEIGGASNIVVQIEGDRNTVNLNLNPMPSCWNQSLKSCDE
jgi:hypothetical protein